MTRITLESRHLSIAIKQKGAELCSLNYQGEPLLWHADPSIWPRHAPVLFPIVGRLKHDRLRHRGRDYPLNQHGFARDLPFELLHHRHDSAAWLLSSTEFTRRHYPFDFELVVHYQLREQRLCIDYRVSNNSPDTLPCGIGAHPAFRWPLHGNADKSDHRIVFQQAEPAPVRRLQEGLLATESQPTPLQGDTLRLNDSLFLDDALIFDQLRSKHVTYLAPRGPGIRVYFEGFPHLGIWSKPGASFICIEPWHGYASPANFDGEFSGKPGICHIPPFSEKLWRHCIEILPSPAIN